MTNVNAVLGPISADDLGVTLMHEHLIVGYPGWESDTIRPGRKRSEMLAVCIDRIRQLQERGIKSFVDPCPNDLGRDVEFSAQVAQETGLQIICATGLYTEESGGAPYWKFNANTGGGLSSIAELFVREVTDGVSGTGIRPGVIKVGTGHGAISNYEETILHAAAIASNETGTPIMTHTEQGQLGDQQQKILTSNGVPAHRIIIGHSCGTTDHNYHMHIVNRGSYLGFDRFGVEPLMPDADRAKALMALIDKGKLRQLIVSHDSAWCWRGDPIGSPEIKAYITSIANNCHFHDNIIPLLKSMGATDRHIETLLVDNPRRFFTGEPSTGTTK